MVVDAVSCWPRWPSGDLTSMLLNPVVGFAKHPRRASGDDPRPPVPVRDATLSLGELKRIAREVLPGAVIRRRLFFRHTISWTKPRTSGD